jgi:DNA-binding beta-propeller fold protein YncE
VTLEPAGFVRLPGGERTGFDHADANLGHIYVAHTATDAVDVIDCRTNTYVRSLPDLPGVAGVLIDTGQDLLFTSDRSAARVSIFRCTDGTLLAQVGVGPRPNGLAFDPGRRRLYSFNLGEPPGTGCTASVISIDERRVVRTIGLPGRPRWAVFDPSGDRVYVAIQNPAILFAIDADRLEESARIDVGAHGPHGLALVGRQLFCAADGGEVAVIDLDDGHVVRRLALPGIPDVVMHDDRGNRLFVAVGTPGTVTVFDTERLVEVQTVKTEEGAHTIGWDPSTAQLYVFAPQRGGALVFQRSSGGRTPRKVT